MKRQILSVAMCIYSVAAFAQSGTNSPYSQYGLGVLSDQSQGFNRGMNGLAMGLRQSNQVNVLNPASYSAMDSLTLIFDIGVSGQITSFEEGGKKLNANNSNFEYVVGSFRAMPGMGVSFGLLPFSNIGFNYSTSIGVGTPVPGTAATSSVETHSGSGGLHQAFVGVGWEIMRGLSVGANASYLWGTYDKNVAVVSSDAYVNSVVRSYGVTVNSYKLDFGLQYRYDLDKENNVTLGATYGYGHSLGADSYVKVSTTNNQTSVSSSTEYAVKDALSIPHSFGIGLAWQHNKKWTVGADYSLQKWGELDYPEIDYSKDEYYVLRSGLLDDRHKITIGGEYIPNEFGNKFLGRVRYRMGASFATPYFKVNGCDGPKEYSVSAGFGIPIRVSQSRVSLLNVSGQWAHTGATGLIKENTFRINIGLTFNERWFAKWKVE